MTAELIPSQSDNTNSPEVPSPPRLQLLKSVESVAESTKNEYQETLLDQIASLREELRGIDGELSRRLHAPKFSGDASSGDVGVPRGNADAYQIPFIKRSAIETEIGQLQQALEQARDNVIPIERKLGAGATRQAAAPQV